MRGLVGHRREGEGWSTAPRMVKGGWPSLFGGKGWKTYKEFILVLTLNDMYGNTVVTVTLQSHIRKMMSSPHKMSSL